MFVCVRINPKAERRRVSRIQDSSEINNGLNVNHDNAGKNIIGTARPGKSSGFLTVNGSETEIGKITAANERIEMNILKNIIRLFFATPLKK